MLDVSRRECDDRRRRHGRAGESERRRGRRAGRFGGRGGVGPRRSLSQRCRMGGGPRGDPGANLPLLQYKGKLGSSAATRMRALQATSDHRQGAVPALHLRVAQGATRTSSVAANQERSSQAQDVFTAIGEATAWIESRDLTRRPARRSKPSSPPTRACKVRVPACATRCARRRTRCRRKARRCSRRPDTRSPGRRTFATSSSRRTFPRPTVKLSPTAPRSGSTTRAIRWPARRPTAPTASWSSTSSGGATRRSRIRSARRLARQVKGDDVPRQGAQVRQRAAGGARRAQLPEGVYRSLIAETNPACRCCTAISSCAGGCSACPTWAITTSIRRW